MSVENVREFMKRVTEDESLQAQLKAAQDAYAGDRDDREAVAREVILPVAVSAGLPFTLDDLKAAEKEERQGSELSDDELGQVAGGVEENSWGLCVGFGITGDTTTCVMLGYGHLCVVAGTD